MRDDSEYEQDIIEIADFMGEPEALRQPMVTIEPTGIDERGKSLNGKVALITGGGSGLGLAYARAMAQLGAHVAIASRDHRKLQEAVDLIKGEGGDATAFTMNLLKPESIHQAVNAIESSIGPIDILINNAGIGGRVEPWYKAVNSGRWKKIMRTNYHGTFYCTGVVCERMHLRNRGCIVNIASSTVVSRPSNLGIYAYSKWKIVEMVQIVAPALNAAGLRIFAVHPGTVRTPMTESMLKSERGEKLPLLRHIFETHQDMPEEVSAELILYIVSGAVDHLSGKFLCRKEGTVTGITRGL